MGSSDDDVDDELIINDTVEVDVIDDDDAVYDLVELQRKVERGRVESVLSLHTHIVNLIDSAHITGPKRLVGSQ